MNSAWLSAFSLFLILTIKAEDYLLVSTPMTWNDAENHCIAQGGHLASISSECENDAVGDLCKEAVPNSLYNTEDNPYSVDACWIGLKGDGWSYGDWNDVEWIDGTTYSYNQWFGFTWSSLHGQVIGDCGYISKRSNSGSDGYWLMADCDQYQYPFVCEIDPCPEQETTNADCLALYQCAKGQGLICEYPEYEEAEPLRISRANGDALFQFQDNDNNDEHYDTVYVQNLVKLVMVLGVYAICTTAILCVYQYKNWQDGRGKSEAGN